MNFTDGSWRSNWTAFVQDVARLHTEGLSDAEISTAFGGQWVRWTGIVTAVKLDAKYARGVQFEMSRVAVPLASGTVLQASHLFLNVAADDADAWRKASPGDSVSFDGQLVEGSGPFPGISIAKYDQAHLMLGMVNARVHRIH